MRKIVSMGFAMGAALAALPAQAQDNKRHVAPSPGSPLAQQAMASATQPDVLLDIPDLSVEEITLEVKDLQAHIALDARLANLLKLTAGADVSIGDVKLTVKGVHAQATLIVRLENVRAIIERTLQTLDNNPQMVDRLLSTVDNTVGTVGGVANNAVGTVGNVATSALRDGQVLNLVNTGLTQVSRTLNGSGQTVTRVRDRGGQLFDVVTDSANKILSSRKVSPSAPQ